MARELSPEITNGIVLHAELGEFVVIKKHICDAGKAVCASDREVNQCIVAADEIFTNIVKYAYSPEDEEKTIYFALMFDLEEKKLSMKFCDRGIPFDPLDKPAQLPVERIRQRIPGGIGLFLVTRFMDELRYRRENNCNVLVVSKVLSRPDDGGK